jgi:ubiquitin-like protein Pup
MAPSGEQTRKPRPKQDEAQEAEAKTEAKSETADEVDELLDEIDEVLEVNAEEFVRGFIQKGGE